MKAPPELSVDVHSDLVVLTPNIGRRSVEGARAEPSHDSTLRGTVRLSLNRDTRIKRVTVELLGKQEIIVKGVYHTYDTLKKSLELSLGDGTESILPAGLHEFAFEFVVPADAAPLEKCPHGSTEYKLVATAQGTGLFALDLTAERKVSLITNHSEDSAVPPGFNAISKSANEHLGIVGINLTSPFLLLNGNLHLSIDVPSIEHAAVRVDDVRLSLVQSFKLQSQSEPGRTEDIHPLVVPLWSMRESRTSPARGITLRHGQDFHFEKRIVFPEDGQIRPSTSQHSKTGIRVLHRLAVSLLYTPLQAEGACAPTKSEPRMKEVHMTTPATLSSCCCVVEALQLPAYEDNQELKAINQKACDERAKALFG